MDLYKPGKTYKADPNLPVKTKPKKVQEDMATKVAGSKVKAVKKNKLQEEKKIVVSYCLKCKKKHEMKDAKKVTKSGRKFLMGKCPKHGNKMALIVGK